MGGELAVVPANGTLHPMVPERVWIALTEGDRPVLAPPIVETDAGRVRFSGEATVPGIWPVLVTADGPGDLELVVRSSGIERTVTLPVAWPERTTLQIPARVEALAQGEPVEILVTGPDLPAPDQLDVVVGEGRVVERTATPDGIRLLLELEDRPSARLVSIGVRDQRHPSRPTWGEIRVRARPRIPLEADPGARIRLTVGERGYGPFVADSEGRLAPRIDQYPGETSVVVHLEDDLGNATTSTLPLNAPTTPGLVALPGARPSAGRPPRVVWLRAVHAAGRLWQEDLPACRSPAVGNLPVVSIAPGLYAVPLDGRTRDVRADIRLECRLQDASTSLRIGPRADAPTDVLLQVWPTELSTDLPVAEIRVAVQDAEGQRLDPSRVQLSATHGRIRDVSARQDVLRAEYDGRRAVEPGVDTVSARYVHPVATGDAASIELGWQPLPSLDVLRLTARPHDLLGHPVAQRRIQLVLGGETLTVTTDDEGVAQVDLPRPTGPTPLTVSARSDAAFVQGLLLPSATQSFTVDSRGRVESLLASRELTLSPGRVSGISVAFDPPILRTGRNSVAYVTVGLEDRAGRPVTDQPVRLEVSEGSVGPLVPRPDGSLVAEYTPDSSDRAREITVTASTDTLKSTGRLTLEPRLGRVLIGPSVGWSSNLGRISSPRVGFVADVRTRLLAETLVLRASAGGYAVRGRASTGLGEDVELAGSVLPLTVGVLLRQDRGGVSFWGGGGGTLALHPTTARFGNAIVGRGASVLGGGAIQGGIGYRLGVGEIVAELEWAFLPATGGQLAFTGNLGGLTASTGFRLVY